MTPISLLLYIGIKSCGRVAGKFGLRTWTINLRTWIFGLTCLVFKTTYIDAGKPLREGAFFFTGRTLFLPLNKRNTCDKVQGLRISSESYIGELGARCFSILNRGRDSMQQSLFGSTDIIAVSLQSQVRRTSSE